MKQTLLVLTITILAGAAMANQILYSQLPAQQVALIESAIQRDLATYLKQHPSIRPQADILMQIIESEASSFRTERLNKLIHVVELVLENDLGALGTQVELTSLLDAEQTNDDYCSAPRVTVMRAQNSKVFNFASLEESCD